jgi:two-component system response regulator
MTNQYPPITILNAEDDPDDRILVQDAFLESGQDNTLRFVQDGDDLLQYLRRQGSYSTPEQAPRPDLILLDLNMPHKDGRESLAEIKSDPNLRSIPVVVLTASNSDEDILNTYNLGGAGFIIKPETYQGLVEVVKGLNQYWFEVVELANGERTDKIRYNHSHSSHPRGTI